MSGGETLDERYFNWLYSKIGAVSNRNPSRSHWLLAEQLFRKPFLWFVPNDDNRIKDGQALRDEFLKEEGLKPRAIGKDWLEIECSMLEMLIALSRHCAYQGYGEPIEWFWRMLENLSIAQYNDDAIHPRVQEAIDRIMNTINDRDYTSDGRGGLFPLRDPQMDQTKIELWYQMSEYLMEDQVMLEILNGD